MYATHILSLRIIKIFNQISAYNYKIGGKVCLDQDIHV